jgi:hypothetical protein
MENLYYVFIQHQITQDLAGKPKSLEISQLVHMPDIDQEGVTTVVQLDHLDKTSTSQTTLQVHTHDRATQNGPSAAT